MGEGHAQPETHGTRRRERTAAARSLKAVRRGRQEPWRTRPEGDGHKALVCPQNGNDKASA